MDNEMTRRSFTSTLGRGVVGVLFGGMLASSAQLRDQKRGRASRLGEFTGVSRKADFNEALNNAVDQASRECDSRGRDTVQYRVTEISGTVGGRVRRGVMVVKIDAEVV